VSEGEPFKQPSCENSRQFQTNQKVFYQRASMTRTRCGRRRRWCGRQAEQ